MVRDVARWSDVTPCLTYQYPPGEGRLPPLGVICRDGTGANTGVCTGSRDGAMASIEVLTGPERRRRWSDEEKRAIVTAAFAPGAVVRDVARRADVTPSLIYRWRRDLQAVANGFARVLVAPGGDGAVAATPVIELELPGGVSARIPGSISPQLAAAVVEALARRPVRRSTECEGE